MAPIILTHAPRYKDFDSRWLTSDVVDVARGIYEDKAFERMPILADALMDAGCEDEQIIGHLRSDIQHGRGCRVLPLILGQKVVSKNTYSVVVDYQRSIKDGVLAGKYSGCSPNINDENFPASEEEVGIKEQSLVLYRCKRPMKTSTLIKRMIRDGNRPATLRELFAFCENYLEFKRKFPVTALGSVWTGTFSETLFVPRLAIQGDLGVTDYEGVVEFTSLRYLAVVR